MNITRDVIAKAKQAIVSQQHINRQNSTGLIGIFEHGGKQIVAKAPKEDAGIDTFLSGVKALEILDHHPQTPNYYGFVDAMKTPSGKKPCVFMSFIPGKMLPDLKYTQGFSDQDYLNRWFKEMYGLHREFVEQYGVFIPDVNKKNFIFTPEERLVRVDLDMAEFGFGNEWIGEQLNRLNEDEKLVREGLSKFFQYKEKLRDPK